MTPIVSDSVAEALQEHFAQVVLMAPFAGIALLFAFKQGFFHLPKPRIARSSSIPECSQVLTGIVLYILIQAVVALVGLSVLKNLSSSVPGSPPLLKEWVSLCAVFAAAIGVITYVWFTKSGALRPLWLGEKGPSYEIKAFFAGAASWIIAFPIVMFLAHVLAVMILYLFQTVPEEQVAVDFYRSTQSNLWMLVLSTLLIGVLVPVVEEVLFRMLLQSTLRRKFSSWPAIIVTSIVFSLFHYAGQQGIANIQLLTSLFILSLFLGVLYEKWNTLWSSIGLHAVFNTMSMLLLSFSS